MTEKKVKVTVDHGLLYKEGGCETPIQIQINGLDCGVEFENKIDETVILQVERSNLKL